MVTVRTALAGESLRPGETGSSPRRAVAFVAIASLGSTRNLGIRYLLPIAPLAIVWISGLADANTWARRLAWDRRGRAGDRRGLDPPVRAFVFQRTGRRANRRTQDPLDSNLDWAQGLKPLARLQREQPELRDLTLYYFGDSEAERYGVAGPCLHRARAPIPTSTSRWSWPPQPNTWASRPRCSGDHGGLRDSSVPLDGSQADLLHPGYDHRHLSDGRYSGPFARETRVTADRSSRQFARSRARTRASLDQKGIREGESVRTRLTISRPIRSTVRTAGQ